MEADFFQYYGLDITLMGQPGLSFARVERLLLRLPMESRLMVNLTGSSIKWTVENEQLASIFDALNLLLWQNANQGKKKSQWSEFPPKYPRPGEIKQTQEKKEREAELAKKLLEQRERLNV